MVSVSQKQNYCLRCNEFLKYFDYDCMTESEFLDYGETGDVLLFE